MKVKKLSTLVHLYSDCSPYSLNCHRGSGESKPERTGTPFWGPIETEDSVPGPQNVNIRTGTIVPGPIDTIFKLHTSIIQCIFGSGRVQKAASPLGSLLRSTDPL